MRLTILWWILASLGAARAPTTHEGIKLVVSEAVPGGARETTEYIAGDRARVESRFSSRMTSRVEDHASVHIRRCDLDRMILLNVAEQTYQTVPLRSQLTPVERATLLLRRRDNRPERPPDIIVETKTVDTGERRIAFGHSARRVITTRRQFHAVNPDAADERVTDGWYIDLDIRLSCERSQGPGRGVLVAVASSSSTPIDAPRVAFRDIGPAEEGFPIETVITFKSGGQAPRAAQATPLVTRRVVTQLVRQPLDAQLFEIPAGFRSADREPSQLTAGWSRTLYIIRSVVASWFR